MEHKTEEEMSKAELFNLLLQLVEEGEHVCWSGNKIVVNDLESVVSHLNLTEDEFLQFLETVQSSTLIVPALVRRLGSLLAEKPEDFEKDFYDALVQVTSRLVPQTVANLSPPMVWDLFKGQDLRTYEPGQLIFRQGNEPDGFYLLLQGSVAVHRRFGVEIEDSESIGEKVAELEAGASFGEIGFSSHSGNRRSASVVAIESTTCFVVSSDTFDLVYGEYTKQFDAKVEALKANYAFGHRTLDDLYTLAARMQRKVVMAKHRVTQSRDQVAFIRKGSVRIFHDDRQVALIGKDDIFGMCKIVSSDFDEDDEKQYAVAETDNTVVYIVSLEVARHLSLADSRTLALLAERAQVRRNWHSVVTAAPASEPILITFDMMKFAQYELVDHSKLRHVVKKKRHDNFVLDQTKRLLGAALVLEADGSFGDAETALTHCVDMCKDTLKTIKQARIDGSKPDQHAELIRLLRTRITKCEERDPNDAVQFRRKTNKGRPSNGRVGKTQKQPFQQPKSLKLRQGEDEYQDADASSHSSSSSSSCSDQEDEYMQPSLEEEFDSRAPKITDDMDAATRRRVRLERLEVAIAIGDESNEGKVVMDQDRRKVRQQQVISKNEKNVRFNPQDARAVVDENGMCTLLNHVEVTPPNEVKNRNKRRLASALPKSRALQESGSLLSLEQERTLGQYGLERVSGRKQESRTSAKTHRPRKATGMSRDVSLLSLPHIETASTLAQYPSLSRNKLKYTAANCGVMPDPPPPMNVKKVMQTGRKKA